MRLWRIELGSGVVEGGFWRNGMRGGDSVGRSFWMGRWSDWRLNGGDGVQLHLREILRLNKSALR